MKAAPPRSPIADAITAFTGALAREGVRVERIELDLAGFAALNTEIERTRALYVDGHVHAPCAIAVMTAAGLLHVGTHR